MPTTDNSLDSLKAMAEEIRAWQTSRDLSDREMERKFAGLGSAKTFKKILEGTATDLDLDRWSREYAQLLNLLRTLEAESKRSEELYDDLTPPLHLRAAVTDALGETGNNRLVLLLGEPGAGKTRAVLLLHATFGSTIVGTEANETWKSSAIALCRSILTALNVRPGGHSGPEFFDQTAAALKDHGKTVLIIDEAHHLGPVTLNLVKSFINACPELVVVLCCLPSLWNKLACAAYEEARQLIRNRLAERIVLSLGEQDVETILDRRLEFDARATLRASAKMLTEKARSKGNLNFVTLVARHAKGHPKPLTSAAFAKACTEAEKTR